MVNPITAPIVQITRFGIGNAVPCQNKYRSKLQAKYNFWRLRIQILCWQQVKKNNINFYILLAEMGQVFIFGAEWIEAAKNALQIGTFDPVKQRIRTIGVSRYSAYVATSMTFFVRIHLQMNQNCMQLVKMIMEHLEQ